MLLDRISMTDGCYLSAGAIAAAHQESYRLLHSRSPWWDYTAMAAGVSIIAVSIIANIPVGVLIGGVVVWWGAR
jgi:hypothetical protein